MSSSMDKETEVTQDKMLLLTVAPGKLGLSVRNDQILGGCTITKIDAACTFKDRVEVGDRIVVIDGKRVTNIADLQGNNNKTRSFGIVKHQQQQPTQQAAAAASRVSATATKTSTTPAPKYVRGHPIVTTEKSSTAANKNTTSSINEKANEKGGNFEVLITRPDGSVVNLSPSQRWHMVLGRGSDGIPFDGAHSVPVQACVLRIVEKNNDEQVPKSSSDATSSSNNGHKRYALELAPTGEERCTVLRNGNPIFVTSVSAALTSGLQSKYCPTSIILRSGDIIVPGDLKKARGQGAARYKFKVEIVSGEAGDVVGLDRSAFAVASKKIDEAAGVPRNGEAGMNPSAMKDIEDAMIGQNPFDFDSDTLRLTFLAKPKSTTHFFSAYYKLLIEKNASNANKELGNNLMNAFIDAMSPRDQASRDESKTLTQKIDEHFPLKKLLNILVDCKDAELARRAIEGYVWLSCQKTTVKTSGSGNIISISPRGPILLLSQDLPLARICSKIGWENVESLLVHSLEMLCDHEVSLARAFDLVKNIEPVPSPGSGEKNAAQLRVFFGLAKVAFEKMFTGDQESAADRFIDYNKSLRSKRSYVASDKLINAFVDAMSPLDTASRRVPKTFSGMWFPLKGILETILVDGKHKEFGKRVLEGYVWLSCQKYYGSTPSGPERLGGVVSLACKKIGWDMIGDLLVESTEKLCEFQQTRQAFLLMEEILKELEGSSQSSLACVRLAKMMSEFLNSERFRDNPNETANLFCRQYRRLREEADTELRDSVLNSFVDAICPRDTKSRKAASRPLTDRFPLNDILNLLVNDGQMELGKRVLEGYLWHSCQMVNGYTSGPESLDNADAPLVKLCDALGWDAFESSLIKSVEMLCKFGLRRKAVYLVDKIAPTASEGSSHRLRVCSDMAKIACEKMFPFMSAYRSGHDLSLYKKLLWLVGNYCPGLASKFVAIGKSLDVDVLLYPLLTDSVLRSSPSTDAMKDILNQLTEHCAQLLQPRVSDTDMVTAWKITNPGRFNWTEFGSFLSNQCKQTLDFKVRKKDHAGFQASLRPLINAGEIRCRSHQPGYSVAYHFQITKLKTCKVSKRDLACGCSRINWKFTLEPSTCLHDSSRVDLQNDRAKLDAIKAFLPAGSSLKRKAVDALGGDDDDDDVVMTGVADVAETVAKRVKAAEDAGEVIEIE